LNKPGSGAVKAGLVMGKTRKSGLISDSRGGISKNKENRRKRMRSGAGTMIEKAKAALTLWRGVIEMRG